MAATPEAKVKQQVKQVLDYYGAYYFSPVTGGFGKSGVPDIVACFKGYFIGIECKAGTNKPTALQDREMQRIRDAHGMAFVVNEDTVHKVDELLHMMQEENVDVG